MGAEGSRSPSGHAGESRETIPPLFPMSIHANWQQPHLLLWGGEVDELRDRVGQMSSDALLASVAQATSVRLWLPQDGQIAAKDLPALQFSPAEAIDLLLSLPRPMPAGDCGDSLRFWAALARFVVDRLREQRFYPAVKRANAHHEAFWRLHISAAEEIERLERFAAAMPASCRAIVGNESS